MQVHLHAGRVGGGNRKRWADRENAGIAVDQSPEKEPGSNCSRSDSEGYKQLARTEEGKEIAAEGFEGWWTKTKGRRPAELLRTPLRNHQKGSFSSVKETVERDSTQGNGVPVQIAGEIAAGVTARRSSDFAVTTGNQDRLSSNLA